MKKIVLLFAFFLILSSCSTNNIDVPSSNALNGKWNWVTSTGGFAGTTITPASEKKTIVIEVSKSTIKKYVDGNLVSENVFSIKNQSSIYGGEKSMIVFKDSSNNQSFEIKDNKLYLNDECNDCYHSEYIRMK